MAKKLNKKHSSVTVKPGYSGKFEIFENFFPLHFPIVKECYVKSVTLDL